MRMQMLSSFL